LAGRANVLRTIRELQPNIDCLLQLQRRVALDGHTVFADVYDLVEIEHRALRLGGETCVSRRLNSVPHAPSTIWDRGRRGRINS